jgi:hypothetical protein
MNTIRKLLVVTLVGLFGFAGILSALELNDAQKAYVEDWLVKHDLNRYGDPKGTMYLGGSPLFDESTGTMKDRFQYIFERHPELFDEVSILRAEVSDLQKLETELEMAAKDYVMEKNAPRPDKERLEQLRRRIEELELAIFDLTGTTPVVPRVRGVLPEIFGEEVGAALVSEDYGRICELVVSLRDKGPDAVKHEAETLFDLNRKLRFALQSEPGDKIDDIKLALRYLEPVLDELKV